MSTKGCELCSSPARMFCDSDQASLCWDCDEKVHAANFLVAKHSRTLLCHACQSPTPWTAAGPKLGPCVSVCRDCADRGGASTSHRREDEDGDDSQESESDDGEYFGDSDDVSEEEGEEEEEEEEEDGENQVVPWSASSSDSPAAAAVESYSSSEENVSSSSSKRTRDGLIFDSEDEDGCCSSQNLDHPKLGAPELSFQVSDENYSSSLSLLRPLKMRRRSIDAALIPSDQAAGGASRVNPPHGTAAIIEKLQRIQQEIVTEEAGASTMILGLHKLTRN